MRTAAAKAGAAALLGWLCTGRLWWEGRLEGGLLRRRLAESILLWLLLLLRRRLEVGSTCKPGRPCGRKALQTTSIHARGLGRLTLAKCGSSNEALRGRIQGVCHASMPKVTRVRGLLWAVRRRCAE